MQFFLCVCVLKRSENAKIQEKLKVAVYFAHSTTNQKYYPDVGPSSVWNLYTHSSNLMSFHCQCWHHKLLNNLTETVIITVSEAMKPSIILSFYR